jgi:hypothetical protein
VSSCSHGSNSKAVEEEDITSPKSAPSSGGGGGGTSYPKSQPTPQVTPPPSEDEKDEEAGDETEEENEDEPEGEGKNENEDEEDEDTPYTIRPEDWGPRETPGNYYFEVIENGEVLIINLYERSLPWFNPEDPIIPNPDFYELVHAEDGDDKYTEPGDFPIGTWHNRLEGDREWLVFTADKVSAYSHWFSNTEYSYTISGNEITLSFLRTLETDESEINRKRKIYKYW